MNSLYDKIRYWLTDYVHKDELPGVSAMIYNIAKKYSWAAFRVGLILGLIIGCLLIQWLR
jgi:hypothetical protein